MRKEIRTDTGALHNLTRSWAVEDSVAGRGSSRFKIQPVGERVSEGSTALEEAGEETNHTDLATHGRISGFHPGKTLGSLRI